MKKLFLLLTIFCVFGIGASAQVQQDTLITDYPGGISANGTQTLTNKTLTSPKITTQTSLPTCTSVKEGNTDYYKAATAPGFIVSCIDNGGLYELVPAGQATAGFLWFVWEFIKDSQGIVTNDYWSDGASSSTHPGEGYSFTQATGKDAGFVSFQSDASSTDSGIFFEGATGWTVEWVAKTYSAIANVRYLVGLSSENNVATPDEDVAFFRYDTGNSDTTWIAVTRDNTTETETVTDTGITVSTSTWYRFIIVRSASDIKFYIGTSGGDVALEATHTTNLPNTEKMYPYAEVREISASYNELHYDYLRVSQLGIDR